MLNFLKEFESNLDMKITISRETEPLGTAGPLALARDKLVDESGEPFFALNSDVISEYPLKQMIHFHTSHGGEASIMVTQVNMNTSYCFKMFSYYAMPAYNFFSMCFKLYRKPNLIFIGERAFKVWSCGYGRDYWTS